METIIDEYLIVAIDNVGECHTVAYGCSCVYANCFRTIEKLGQSEYDCITNSDGAVVETGHKLPALTFEDINSYFQSECTETMKKAIAASGVNELPISRFVSVATYGHGQLMCTEHEQEGMYSATLNLQRIPAHIANNSVEGIAKLIVQMGIDGLRYFINQPE